MTLALGLLIAALGLFWISTRQFPLVVRSAIWVAGAALLTLAATSAPHSEFGLWTAVGDALSQKRLSESAIYRALLLNAGTVAPFLSQLFDFFVVTSAALGVLALLAFTRGEWLERLLRPAIIVILGFTAGSVATLAVVAIGFGGYSRPRTFTSDGQQVRVHDGDTFWIGEHSLRLFGIDAPEARQTCKGLADERCGVTARDHLGELLARGTLQCDQMLSRENRRPRDTFGRALVRCWLIEENSRIDLAEELVRTGYAVQYEGDDYGYGAAQISAQRQQVGLLSGCWLRPDIQRSRRVEDQATREDFANGRPLDADVPMVGVCSERQ